MPKIFFKILLVLAATIAITALVDKGDGYILIAFLGYTLEMPMLAGLLLLLLVYLLLSLFIWLLTAVFSAPGNVSRWVGSQKQKQSINRTSQGLVAYIEGRWDYASKSLQRSAAGSSTPFVNYLFAARASSELGDVKAVNLLLQKAEQVSEDADVAIGLTQAELQLANRQYEQALATLLRVRRQSHNHPVGSQLLSQVYVELGDWQNLLKLLPSVDEEAISSAEKIRLENLCCQQLLSKAESDGRLAELQAEWKRLPAQARKRQEVITNFVLALLRNGHAVEAEGIVRHQLQRSFSSEMAELYGMTQDEKPARQFAFAEKLLKSYEADSALLLTMGRLSLRMDDQDSAKKFFERSIEQNHSAAAFAELANLYATTGDYKNSASLFAKAAMLRGGSSSLPLALGGKQDNQLERANDSAE